jgi:hypothetical protein
MPASRRMELAPSAERSPTSRVRLATFTDINEKIPAAERVQRFHDRADSERRCGTPFSCQPILG